MASFKQAALSVTNLYKAAASEHEKVYQEGYQDCLEDLLHFLDREELGLQDGEGWRVRRWATERFDAARGGSAGVESEGEEEKEESAETVRRKISPEKMERTEEARAESAPPSSETTAAMTRETNQLKSELPIQSYTVPSSEFTFSTPQIYPHPPPTNDTDMETSTDNSGLLHINLPLPRTSRNSRQNSRGLPRTGSNLSLGHGAGVKRRMPNFDFFDLGGFNGKDPFGGSGGGGGNVGGGGKRGRFT